MGCKHVGLKFENDDFIVTSSRVSSLIHRPFTGNYSVLTTSMGENKANVSSCDNSDMSFLNFSTVSVLAF